MLFWHMVCSDFVARSDVICEAELGVNGAFAFVPAFDRYTLSSGGCWYGIKRREIRRVI